MINSFLNFIKELMSNIWLYLIMVLATGAVVFYTYTLILNLPKPETYTSTVIFYFQHAWVYLQMLLMTFVSFILAGTVTISSAGLSVVSFSENKFYAILFGIVAVSAIVSTFYFLSYVLWLLFVLLTISIVIFFLFSGSGRSR